ncbi:MAG: hypothetical protein GY839_19815 [candidate division Zixibacteria bacterium]|nr:hypothetical protein [candidate division Zixibacteria bacterium]
MSSIRFFVLTIVIILATTSGALCGERILVVKFDCLGEAKNLSGPLADSLIANLNTLRVPVVSRDSWRSILNRKGYSESELNYDFVKLSGLAETAGAKGAVYGQVYKKDGLLILDTYYIEPGFKKPIDIDPMVGYTRNDILEMTWDLAVVLSKSDMIKPEVISTLPSDSSVIADERALITICFDEPMNPDCFGLEGEPKDMFFIYGDVNYDSENYCFEFQVHLYPGIEYRFWANGPGLKPFKDTAGNVAESYQWSIITN